MLKLFILNLISLGLWSKFVESGSLVGFQEIGSMVFNNIVDFHDYIIMYLLFIFVVVLWSLIWALCYYPLKDSLHWFYCVIIGAKYFLIYQYKKISFKFVKQEDGSYKLTVLKSAIITENEDQFLNKMFFDVLVVSKYLVEHIKNPSYFALNIFLSFFTFWPRIWFAIRSLPNFVFDMNAYPIVSHYIVKTYKEFTQETDLFLRNWIHSTSLEILWTIFPSFILLAIAIPSLILLYELDAVEPISLGIKVIGHQWYWSYEIGGSIPLISLFQTITSFDSYMISDEISNVRLLEVDNPLFVPAGTPLTFLVTSTDVIHSWAVPSLGIKMDAIPGRINRVAVTIVDIGCYFGQCSELCGVNHGFMPINIMSYAQPREIAL